jgi:hypothetical protein
MMSLRLGICALVLGATVPLLAACSDSQPPGQPSVPTASSSGQSTPTNGPTGSATSDPTESPSEGPSSTSAPTNSDQPVPKVQRGDQTATPSISAQPTSIAKPARYPDGISLRIRSVDFARETKKGPGSFPKRPYAVLTMRVDNRSKKSLSMATVVITVLDRNGKAVAPVYTQEAKVQDFSGVLKPNKSAQARYAFAVPKSSRSKVTVVIDFDGQHTSAVFRGKLS